MLTAKQVLAAYERSHGIVIPGAVEFATDEWKYDFEMAMDAQPALVTTASSGIPSFLTTLIDPQMLQILTAPNDATSIFEEVKKGDWVDETAMFPVIEHAGFVTSYGDYNNLGRTSVNPTFPQRQAYLYQTFIEYGDLELDRAARARINWAGELRNSAIMILEKFANLIYFKGIAGLQNYGIQTDPNLNPSIAPAPKVNGGFAWLSGSAPNATASEIFSDIESLVNTVIIQGRGNINKKTEMILALSPSRDGAMAATNSFNVNVEDQLKKNYPNLRVQTAVQYEALSATNAQGFAAGEMAQLICPNVGGQQSGWCAFNTKLRAGRIIPKASTFEQKMTQGNWGAVIRQPWAIATMIGI